MFKFFVFQYIVFGLFNESIKIFFKKACLELNKQIGVYKNIGEFLLRNRLYIHEKTRAHT